MGKLYNIVFTDLPIFHCLACACNIQLGWVSACMQVAVASLACTVLVGRPTGNIVYGLGGGSEQGSHKNKIAGLKSSRVTESARSECQISQQQHLLVG